MYAARAFYLWAFAQVVAPLYFVYVFQDLHFGYLYKGIAVAYFFQYIRFKIEGCNALRRLFGFPYQFLAPLKRKPVCFERLPCKTIDYGFYGLYLEILFFEL
jgi:hypothetical protein